MKGFAMGVLLNSLEVVTPLFFIMIIGWVLRRIGILDEKSLGGITKLVYSLLLPCNLFMLVYSGDYSQPIDVRFIVFAIFGMVTCFTLSIMIVPHFEKDRTKCGVIAHAISRGNTALYGIPLAVGIFGAGHLGNLGVLLAIMVFIGNIGAVISLEVFRDKKLNFVSILMRVIKSPIIIFSACGAVIVALGISLPSFILTPISYMSNSVTALSFIALGGSFSFAGLHKYKTQLTAITLFKLVVSPLIWVTIGAFVLGFREIYLVALLCIFATPVPVSLFPMTKSIGGDSELSNDAVVVTTALSVVSLFGFVYLFNYLGYFA